VQARNIIIIVIASRMGGARTPRGALDGIYNNIIFGFYIINFPSCLKMQYALAWVLVASDDVSRVHDLFS